jgi:hypothetical protein
MRNLAQTHAMRYFRLERVVSAARFPALFRLVGDFEVVGRRSKYPPMPRAGDIP